jgi:hypothetical protein
MDIFKEYLARTDREVPGGHQIGSYGQYIHLPFAGEDDVVWAGSTPAFKLDLRGDFPNDVNLLTTSIFFSAKHLPRKDHIYMLGRRQVGHGDKGHYVRFLESGDDITEIVSAELVAYKAKLDERRREEFEAWRRAEPSFVERVLEMASEKGRTPKHCTNNYGNPLVGADRIKLLKAHFGARWDEFNP